MEVKLKGVSKEEESLRSRAHGASIVLKFFYDFLNQLEIVV